MLRLVNENRNLVTPSLNFLFAFFLTIGLAWPAVLRADDKLPDVESKAITKQSQEEGEEESWGIETQTRQTQIYPSNWGQAGIFRLRSAESLPEGTLTFGIGGEFYAVSDAPDFGTGSQARTIAENIFVGYSPVERLTLGLTRRSSSTTFGEPAQLVSSLGDIYFSGTYSIPINRLFAVAPITHILIASNFNNLAPAGNTLSASVGLAGTVSLFDVVGIPLFAHANILYSMPQIRGIAPAGVSQETFFSFSRYDTVTFGLGAEFRLGDFTPFFEFMDTMHASSGVNFGRSPSKISIGSRFTPLDNKSLAFLLGADIALGRGVTVGVPFSPGYQILGQISYTVGLTQTERKHYFTTKDVNVVDRKFVIKRNINFKVGSTELENDSKKLLDQIAQVIQENKVKKLLIVGHTDSSHNEDYNLKLSVDRANAVKTYLVGRGIPSDSLMTQGYGRKKPRASNLTEEGRALNRRVEFLIVE